MPGYYTMDSRGKSKDIIQRPGSSQANFQHFALSHVKQTAHIFECYICKENGLHFYVIPMPVSCLDR